MRAEVLKKFSQLFNEGSVVSRVEISDFLRQFNNTIKNSTISWRIYELEDSGYINRMGNSQYRIMNPTGRIHFEYYLDNYVSSKVIEFNSKFSSEHNSFNNLNRFDKAEYEISIWSSSILNSFTKHQRFSQVIIIELNMFREEDLYYYLKDNNVKSIGFTDAYNLDYLFLGESEKTVIEKLPKRSPLIRKSKMTRNMVYAPSIEKILIDIIKYRKILSLDEQEIVDIYKEVFSKYIVNERRLHNYSRIRGTKIQLRVKSILEEINLNAR